MTGDGILQNGSGDELNTTRQSGGLPAKRLGFGLVGSGKRTAVPSVFHEEEDEAQKEKKMRPLVPIDYSAEELQAVQPASTGALPPNLAAAAEFAKRISNVNSKEEKPDSERERGRRSSEKSSRDRDRNDEEAYRNKDENKAIDRDREREHVLEKVKIPDNKKLLDAKQLIDMIPKTKEELFSYDINWTIYEKVPCLMNDFLLISLYIGNIFYKFNATLRSFAAACTTRENETLDFKKDNRVFGGGGNYSCRLHCFKYSGTRKGIPNAGAASVNFG